MTDRITWAHDDIVHGYWAEPGSILAGEYPGGIDQRDTRIRLSMLLDAGVRTFIDLTEPTEGLTPYEPVLVALAAEHNLSVTRSSFPIPDQGALPASSYDAILDAIRHATDDGVVFIHGREGLGRPGTVVGCIFASRGLSYEGSLRTLKERRMYSAGADTRSPSTFAQRDVIAQHAARHRG